MTVELLLPVLAATVLVALAAVGVGAAVLTLKRSVDPVLRRVNGPGEHGEAAAALVAVRPGLQRGFKLMAQAMLGADEGVSAPRRQLIQAGLRRPSALQLFLLSKLVLSVGLPLVFLAFNAMRDEPLRLALPIAVWLCAGGYFLPNLWVSSRVHRRRVLLDRALPDALDLLVTCIEAGLGLEAAVVRVSQDVALSWPLLSEELNLTFLETKAGIPRTEAFRRLYERTGADELKTLSATLAQAEMFGTSIGLALRVQASGMRTRRMYRAEERAAIVAVKMTVPLILCILPSLISILIGPAAVNIYRSLYTKL